MNNHLGNKALVNVCAFILVSSLFSSNVSANTSSVTQASNQEDNISKQSKHIKVDQKNPYQND